MAENINLNEENCTTTTTTVTGVHRGVPNSVHSYISVVSVLRRLLCFFGIHPFTLLNSTLRQVSQPCSWGSVELDVFQLSTLLDTYLQITG